MGTHKTGSSAFQQRLSGYDDGRTFYADFGDPNHSIPLQTLYRDDGNRKHWRAMRGDATERAAAFRATLAACAARPRDRVILSGENASILEPREMRRMRDDLRDLFGHVRVLYVLRHPGDWAVSLLQEQIKHGNCRLSINENPSLHERLATLLTLFPHEDITFVQYERAAAHGGDVVPVLTDRLGLELPLGPLVQAGAKHGAVPSGRANDSLSADAVAVLRRFNLLGLSPRIGPALAAAHWRLVDVLRRMFADGRKLRASDLPNLVTAQDYATANTLVGADYRPPDPVPEAERARLDEVPPHTAERLCQFLAGEGVQVPPTSDADYALTHLWYLLVSQNFNWAYLDPHKGSLAQRVLRRIRQRFGNSG